LDTLLLPISEHANSYNINFCNQTLIYVIEMFAMFCLVVVVVILTWRSTLKRFRHLVWGCDRLVSELLTIVN